MFGHTPFIHVWLYIGWTDELKDSQLSIYQVKVYDHGAEDTFSIIIKKNFSWHLFRRQLVNPTCCSILRNTPSELDSGLYSYIIIVVIVHIH